MFAVNTDWQFINPPHKHFPKDFLGGRGASEGALNKWLCAEERTSPGTTLVVKEKKKINTQPVLTITAEKCSRALTQSREPVIRSLSVGGRHAVAN